MISKGVELKKRGEEVQVGINANEELEREEECVIKQLQSHWKPEHHISVGV